MGPTRTSSFVLLTLRLGCNPVAAQTPFLDRIHLRQDLLTTTHVAKPASITVTAPAEGRTVFQADVGLEIDGYRGTRATVSPFAEFHRNDSIDKEQNSVKSGLKFQWQLLTTGSAGGGRRQSPILVGSTNYKRDRVDMTHSWQDAVAYTHLFTGARKFPMPNLPFRFGGQNPSIEIVYSPYLGVEHERILEATGEATEGTIVRSFAQADLAVYPAPLALRHRLEIGLGYTYRYDIKDSTGESDSSHPLFRFGTTFYFFNDEANTRSLGFGVGYVNGDDPDKGFAEQEYWEASLKFRIK